MSECVTARNSAHAETIQMEESKSLHDCAALPNEKKLAAFIKGEQSLRHCHSCPLRLGSSKLKVLAH